MRKIIVTVALTLVAISALVLAVARSVEIAADSGGSYKYIFGMRESVYAVLEQSIECLGVKQNQQVDVYVMQNNDGWQDGAQLSGAAGFVTKSTATTNQLGHLPKSLVWSAPLTPGKYDMIIDVDRDGKFDNSAGCLEPVDNDTGIGFIVMGSGGFEDGTGAAAGGSTAAGGKGVGIGGHSAWSEAGADPYNEMLQLVIKPAGEPVQITKIKLAAAGTGDDKNDIAKIIIVNDKNANGRLDNQDELLGNGTYDGDNGDALIDLSPAPIIPKDQLFYMLISYEMTRYISGKTYSFSVTRLDALGTNTGQPINLLPNVAINSAWKTATDPPACTGNYTLIFDPDKTGPGENVTGNVTGDFSPACNGFLVTIKKDNCATGEAAGSCRLPLPASKAGCKANVTAPSETGTYPYWACLDKDGDGNYSGTGEISGPATLTVEQKECRQDNLAGCAAKAECEGASGGWCTGDSKCKTKSRVECQPPASNGTKVYCDSSCGWATCTGTSGSCFSEAGKCQSCKSDETCEDFSCVVVKPPCTGKISLEVSAGEKEVTVTAGGLSGCNERIIEFKINDCAGNMIQACEIGAGEGGCSKSLVLPKPGEYTYAACVDMDGDTKFTGAGESDTAPITIKAPFDLTTAGAVGVVIIAVAAGGLMLLKRRKTAQISPAPSVAGEETVE